MRKINLNRYRFYREHKYVSFVLYELEQLISKSDFQLDSEINTVLVQLQSLKNLLHYHALHEEKAFHSLLQNKGSFIYENVEKEHQRHEKWFSEREKDLAKIVASKNERIQKGYEFFLEYRLFVSNQILHFHEEETLLMPEIQSLYTDSELKHVEANTYSQMTSDDLLHMIQTLFPHMDKNDHQAFLDDIAESEPQKFAEISSSLSLRFPQNKRKKTT